MTLCGVNVEICAEMFYYLNPFGRQTGGAFAPTQPDHPLAHKGYLWDNIEKAQKTP